MWTHTENSTDLDSRLQNHAAQHIRQTWFLSMWSTANLNWDVWKCQIHMGFWRCHVDKMMIKFISWFLFNFTYHVSTKNLRITQVTGITFLLDRSSLKSRQHRYHRGLVRSSGDSHAQRNLRRNRLSTGEGCSQTSVSGSSVQMKSCSTAKWNCKILSQYNKKMAESLQSHPQMRVWHD